MSIHPANFYPVTSDPGPTLWHTIFWMHYPRIRNGIICWSYQLLQLEGLKFVPQVATFPWPFRTSILLCGLLVSPMHLSSVTLALPGPHTSKLEIDDQKHCDIIWISSNNPILSTWSSFGYHPPEISINKKQITRDNLLADFIHLWCHNLPPFNLHHPSNVHKARFCLHVYSVLCLVLYRISALNCFQELSSVAVKFNSVHLWL